MVNESNNSTAKLFMILNHIEYELSIFNTAKAECLLGQAELLLTSCTDDNLIPRYYDLYAHLYELAGKHENQLQMCVKAIEKAKDALQRSRCCCIMAECLYSLQRYSEALAYCDKAIKAADEVDQNDGFKTAPLFLKGKIAYRSGDYDKAIEYYNEDAYYAESINMPAEYAIAIWSISKVYEKVGKYEIALNEMFRAERYAKESHNYNFYCKIMLHRANLLFTMGKDADAKHAIQSMAMEYDK